MFSSRRLVAALLGASSLAIAAPPAGAVTATALGSCTAPQPPFANLERLTVPGVVKVGADGRPAGASVGVSVRNRTSVNAGNRMDLYVDVLDVATGRVVGAVQEPTFGCVRYLWSMREFTVGGVPSGAPLTLKRGRLYALRASAGFIDWAPSDPTGGALSALRQPITLFVTN